MAFADPQVVTIDSVANNLARVKSDGLRSEYALADGTLKLTISHQEIKGRFRRMARIDKKIVAADPLSSVNEYKTAGVYIVIDEPEYGFTADDIDDVVQGFKTWLSTANVTKIIGNEH